MIERPTTRPATRTISKLSAVPSSSAIGPRSDAVEEDHPNHAREQQREAGINDRQGSEMGFETDRDQHEAKHRCESNSRGGTKQPGREISARDIDHRVASAAKQGRKRQRA